MKVEVVDLNGEKFPFKGVSNYKFANHETYALPDKLAPSGRTLIVNSNNYLAIFVSDDV